MDTVVASIVASCLEIQTELRNTLPTNEGESQNASGDTQKPLDIITDEIITKHLSKLPEVAGLLSEEQDQYLPCHDQGQYIISFDPLDGSGNSPLNLSTGSIFGIFKTNSVTTLSGDCLIGAVYSIYGPGLEIITATDQGCHRTVYLQGVAHRVNNILTIPERGKIYVANEGNSEKWDPTVRKYVSSLKGRSLRWMACFVADVHRLLLEGGVYLYPSDTKQPRGKLRLVYEVYPMSYIWEKCGGVSVTETGVRCLDLPFNPDNIHERAPILMFGSSEYRDYQKLILGNDV